MKIEIVGPKKCSACDVVKRHFRELGIPFTSRIADDEYMRENAWACNRYPSWPHVWNHDQKENKGFWFSTAMPKITIQRVLKSLNKQNTPVSQNKVVRGR